MLHASAVAMLFVTELRGYRRVLEGRGTHPVGVEACRKLVFEGFSRGYREGGVRLPVASAGAAVSFVEHREMRVNAADLLRCAGSNGARAKRAATAGDASSGPKRRAPKEGRAMRSSLLQVRYQTKRSWSSDKCPTEAVYT